MQPHPQPAHKEQPFLPGFKSAGLPGPFSVVAGIEVCLEQKLQRNTPGVLLSSTCLEPKLQQNMAGAALNRLCLSSAQQSKVAPHRSPTTTIYSILPATLLTLFLGFNQSAVVVELQEFFTGGMGDVAYPNDFLK